MRRPWPALGRSATGKKKWKVVLRSNLQLSLQTICHYEAVDGSNASGHIAVPNFVHVIVTNTAYSIKSIFKNMVKARAFSELGIIQGYSK